MTDAEKIAEIHRLAAGLDPNKVFINYLLLLVDQT